MKCYTIAQLLSKLAEFIQKDNDILIDLAFNRFKDLVYQIEKYKLKRSALELNILFIQGLRKELKSIIVLMKSH